MSAPMQDRDWLTVASSLCRPAAKAKASRPVQEPEPNEFGWCVRCGTVLLAPERCAECGEHQP